MADNYTANAGSGGNTFASDDISSVHYPRAKMVWGADGTANDSAVAAPLPVQGTAESGQISALGTLCTPKFVAINAASNGNNTLLSAVTNKKIRVLSAAFMAGAAVNATFQSGAGGTALTGAIPLAANTGMVLPFNPAGWFETAASTLLNLSLSGAQQVSGALTYIEV